MRATSPTWATELTYLGAEIRARANQLAGADVVREVRVWTGPGPVTAVTTAPSGKGSDEGPNAPSGEAEVDLETAFLRARVAWARRVSRGR